MTLALLLFAINHNIKLKDWTWLELIFYFLLVFFLLVLIWTACQLQLHIYPLYNLSYYCMNSSTELNNKDWIMVHIWTKQGKQMAWHCNALPPNAYMEYVHTYRMYKFWWWWLTCTQTLEFLTQFRPRSKQQLPTTWILNEANAMITQS